MRATLNEVKGAVTKAAVGLGWPFGLAEDIGRASVWLLEQGRCTLAEVVSALEQDKGLPYPIRNDASWVFEGALSLRDGPAALDLLLAGAQSVTLQALDFPNVVAGLAAVRARDTGHTIGLQGDGDACGRVSSLGFSLPQFEVPTNLRLCLAQEASVEIPNQIVRDGVVVDLEDWQRLQRYAAQTYVPNDDRSRSSGAGAGSIDNE